MSAKPSKASKTDEKTDEKTDVAVPDTVSRDDIEAKLRELQGEVDTRVEDVKLSATVVAVAIAVTTVVVAYWLGRRRTKKRQTVFEIRRI